MSVALHMWEGQHKKGSIGAGESSVCQNQILCTASGGFQATKPTHPSCTELTTRVVHYTEIGCCQAQVGVDRGTRGRCNMYVVNTCGETV